MKEIAFDQAWVKNARDFTAYVVRRGIRMKDGLRYDETAIYPKMLGQEFPKTKGHEHPKELIELMIVLRGKAVFLLQKDEGRRIKDVYYVSAKKGEAVVSPSGYSHLTINPAEETLKIGTWMRNEATSTYQNIRKLKGAGYYFTTRGWKKNKNYSKLPRLREEKPLKKIPRDLDFLK